MFVYPHSGLIKDYDGIVEDAESRTLKKADPLKTLPTELWLHILTDIVGSDSTKLLPLLLVSRHWCNVLLAASSLWTNIYIRDLPPDDDGDLSADLLPLSKDLPISVTVEIPSVALDKTHRIWKEMKRIRDLAFKRSPERIRTQSPVDVLAMERFYDTVFHHLSSFDILPIETLTMDHAFDYYSLSMVERRFPIAPNLKAIHFWCMTTESFSNLPTKNLTFLSASSPLEALYACLPPVKQLKRLVLTQAGDAAVNPSPAISIKPGDLPLLEAVEFYQNSPLSMRLLLSAPESHLREVHIKLEWSELQILAPLFSNIQRLDHLHLIFKIPTSELANYDLPLLPLPQVRVLELEQQAIVPVVVEPDQKVVPNPAEAVVASLFDACKANMTEVQDFLLVLHDVIPTAGLLNLLERMRNLASLELKGTFASIKNRGMVLPSVEDLSLSNQELLAFVEFPNVTELYIATKSEFTDSIPPLNTPRLRKLSLHSRLASMLRQDTPQDLHSLTWIDPGGGCASVSRHLNSLVVLKFDHASPRRECNDLCELILRYPYSCRSLTTVEMRAYPEWDILFHMLLRRNFLTGQGVARITTLKLPGYPGISLLEPLAELLSGRFPRNLPPVSELSLGAVDGPYFDVDVTGCEDCIDCRMSCDHAYERHDQALYEAEKGKEIDMSIIDPTEVKPLEGSDPPLPPELQTWFDGWSIRRRTWYAKWQKFDVHSRRKGACERHDYNELVAVTGDLLHGMPYKSHAISILYQQPELLQPCDVQPQPDDQVEALGYTKQLSVHSEETEDHSEPEGGGRNRVVID
ncbi:hypothetical protein FRC19_002952 [Serendipita sp. 401]|nr:hypothetical protein FRC19_002952 [Serendipita sp. 401]